MNLACRWVWCVAAAGLGLSVSSPSHAAADRYWEWGWGIYNATDPLDVARYDWSLVNFGNVPADQRTVHRCNEILRLNPRHRFVVRVWPIMGKGDCKENRFQATFLHFLYKKGVRESVLAETRRQLRLVIDGVSDPASVIGATFLEELPGHFSSNPFRRWRTGDPLPWDLKRFEKEIAAELHEPMDLGKREHRLWWGRRYTQAIEEIHRAMKAAGDGRTVIYWHGTTGNTLDHLADGEDLFKRGVAPIRYKDILKPGACDGIFGYPNNEFVWRKQTQAVVTAHNCLMFSQVSTPASMRLCQFRTAVELARWRQPGNLGTFVYLSGGRGKKAWNELPFLDGVKFWTTGELARKVAWDYKIGLDVVDRVLGPRVELDYDARAKHKGEFVHVFAQVTNPRDPSWYGGDAELARLRNLRLTLSLPDGFALPLENSAPATVTIGDIAPGGCKAGDWWVRVAGDGSIPAGQQFKATVVCDGGVKGEAACGLLERQIPSLKPHEICAARDTWVEAAYRLGSFHPTVELTPLRGDVVFPELRSGGRSVAYRDVLTKGTRLVIGPGRRARLFQEPLFTDPVRRFAKHRAEDGPATFSKGYLVYSTPRVKLRPKEKYGFRLTGSVSDKAISHAIVFLTFKKDGEAGHKNQSCFYNRLRGKTKTVEATVATPEADAGTLHAVIRFYRHNKIGALRLESFDFSLASASGQGADVTDKLEGVLPELARPFTIWTYHDRSDPDRNGRPRLRLRFAKP